jgi:8-oxo-dGTP pyrophosphatase MutT (NUDIX family)
VSRVSALRELLEVYEPSVDEVESVKAILELIVKDDEVMSDDFYTPGHVTGSAFVVDPTHTRLLMIHHAKLGRWLQPGGHIDPGEDVLTAAVREVQEETGVVGLPLLDGIFDVDVHSIPAYRERPAHTHFDVRFLLEAQNEDLTDSDEVLGVRWVPFDEVPSLMTDESVLRATAKLTRR